MTNAYHAARGDDTTFVVAEIKNHLSRYDFYSLLCGAFTYVIFLQVLSKWKNYTISSSFNPRTANTEENFT